MRKLKTMLIALLCAVTTVVSLGAVKSITAKADETSDYVYADTSVISVTANADLPGYPRLELTGVDYKVSNGTYNKGKDYATVAELNTFSKIKIDGVAAGAGYDGTLTDPHLNMYDNSIDRFAFKSDAFTAATEIVVEAGCEFPSFALWSGTGNVVYRTTEDAMFKKEGDVWKKQIVFTYSDTSVIGISANDALPGYPRLELTGVDYKVSNGTYNKGKDYSIIAGLNTFSKIKIDGVAAGAGYDGNLTDPHLNMYDNSIDRFAFKSDAFKTATEIVIEAGCEFPSFALWSGTGTTVYRTTEDVTFKKVDGMWKKTIVYTYENASVTGVSVNGDLPSYPRLELDGVDYKNSNGTYNKGKDYATVAELNTFSKIKIDGVAAGAGYDGTLTDPYLNMYDNGTDRFAFKSDAFTTATEIVIEAGCEFPSYALWSGLGSTVYRTTETYKFKKVNDGWYKVFVATFVDESGNALGASEFTVADETLVYPEIEKEVGYDYTWTGNEIKAENITVTLTKTIKKFDVKIGDAEAVKYNYGTKIEKPADPEKEEDDEYTYTFKGWYNGETEWNFETDVVTENVTLVAKFDSVKKKTESDSSSEIESGSETGSETSSETGSETSSQTGSETGSEASDGSASGDNSTTSRGCFGSVASGLPFVSILLFAGAMIIKTKKKD